MDRATSPPAEGELQPLPLRTRALGHSWPDNRQRLSCPGTETRTVASRPWQWFCPKVANEGTTEVVLAVADAAALIGVVSRIRGESTVRQLDPSLEPALARRLHREGLARRADTTGLQAALADLASRLHVALGE